MDAKSFVMTARQRAEAEKIRIGKEIRARKERGEEITDAELARILFAPHSKS